MKRRFDNVLDSESSRSITIHDTDDEDPIVCNLDGPIDVIIIDDNNGIAGSSELSENDRRTPVSQDPTVLADSELCQESLLQVQSDRPHSRPMKLYLNLCIGDTTQNETVSMTRSSSYDIGDTTQNETVSMTRSSSYDGTDFGESVHNECISNREKKRLLDASTIDADFRLLDASTIDANFSDPTAAPVALIMNSRKASIMMMSTISTSGSLEPWLPPTKTTSSNVSNHHVECYVSMCRDEFELSTCKYLRSSKEVQFTSFKRKVPPKRRSMTTPSNLGEDKLNLFAYVPLRAVSEDEIEDFNSSYDAGSDKNDNVREDQNDDNNVTTSDYGTGSADNSAVDDNDDRISIACSDKAEEKIGRLRSRKHRTWNIEGCLVCGTIKRRLHDHPFFKGKVCFKCRTGFMGSIYWFGDDRTNSYCVVCGIGGSLFVCSNPGCNKVYCHSCVMRLVGTDAVQFINACPSWICFLCRSLTEMPSVNDIVLPGSECGLLVGRVDWLQRLELCFQPRPLRPLSPASRGLRVLSLFDGIGSGLVALKKLGIAIEAYFASEIDHDAMAVTKIRHHDIITHIGCVTKITRFSLDELGPIDLVLGGSPCNDFSYVNPLRRGLRGQSGRLFFEYVRVLNCTIQSNRGRPVMFLHENILRMEGSIQKTISKFLSCEPIKIDAADFSAMIRPRNFWGNIPLMYQPFQYCKKQPHAVSLSDILFPKRTAATVKIRTITTNGESLKFGDVVNEENHPDTLWIQEIERLFGFPDHYTDVANLCVSSRRKLLGRAWSVPVIIHLLSPLTRLFPTQSSN